MAAITAAHMAHRAAAMAKKENRTGVFLNCFEDVGAEVGEIAATPFVAYIAHMVFSFFVGREKCCRRFVDAMLGKIICFYCWRVSHEVYFGSVVFGQKECGLAGV